MLSIPSSSFSFHHEVPISWCPIWKPIDWDLLPGHISEPPDPGTRRPSPQVMLPCSLSPSHPPLPPSTTRSILTLSSAAPHIGHARLRGAPLAPGRPRVRRWRGRAEAHGRLAERSGASEMGWGMGSGSVVVFVDRCSMIISGLPLNYCTPHPICDGLAWSRCVSL